MEGAHTEIHWREAPTEHKAQEVILRGIDVQWNKRSLLVFVIFIMYTPSNQQFKAFLVSKFNSETSFLYQLFKENSTFIVTEPMQGNL